MSACTGKERACWLAQALSSGGPRAQPGRRGVACVKEADSDASVFPFPEFRVRWGWVLYLERKTLLVRANISPQTISLGTIRERISQPLGAVRGTHSNWIVFHPLFKAQSLSQQTEPVSHIGVAMTIVIQKTALKEIKISPEIRHRSAKKPS